MELDPEASVVIACVIFVGLAAAWIYNLVDIVKYLIEDRRNRK